MKAFATLALVAGLGLSAPAAIAQSALIDGQIVKVDQSAGKITIKHGPIRKLGMDPLVSGSILMDMVHGVDSSGF